MLPSAGPLAGRTIVVTRTREQSGTLAEALTSLGARVLELPTIAIVPPESYAPLDASLRRLATYDWLVVTSANAARVLGERLRHAIPQALQVAAVGRATAEALTSAGFRVALAPEPFVAESLVAALAGQVQGRRVLLARAAVARDVLPLALTAQGAQVDIVDAYRTVLPPESCERVREIFSQQQPDGVSFTSSSTVSNFLALLEKAGVSRPDTLRAFSIGPITSATLVSHKWPPAAEAAQHDVPGLVAALTQYFNALGAG